MAFVLLCLHDVLQVSPGSTRQIFLKALGRRRSHCVEGPCYLLSPWTPGGLCPLAAVSSAAMNKGMQYLSHPCSVPVSVPSSGVAGPHVVLFNLLKNHQTVQPAAR